MVLTPRMSPLVVAFVAFTAMHCGGKSIGDPGTGEGSNPNDSAGSSGAGTGSSGTGTGTGGTGRPKGVPLKHRATAQECPRDRAPGGSPFDSGVGGPPGGCQKDSECTAGENARCDYPAENLHSGFRCSADACFTDSECPGSAACICGGQGGVTRAAHACVPGNCRVDADCGSGGYCSPSGGICPGEAASYRCHTANDECTNDSDCNADARGKGSCEWQATVGHWMCSYSHSCPVG